MNPGIWLLPAVGLLSGLASLQIDPKEQPKKRWVLILMLLVSAIGTIWVAQHDSQAHIKEKRIDDDNISFLKTTVSNLSGQSQHISDTTDSVLHLLESAGVSQNTIRVVQQAKAADVSRTAILQQTLATNEKQKAVVWYYPKDVDGPKVRAALEQGGFTVTDRPGNPRNLALPTNAIWVGDDITLDQAKFVALTLIRAGVEIKSLKKLSSGGGNKAVVIEVGTDASLQSAQPLTAEQVASLSQLKRE